MKINTALILCAGYGKRLNPLTLKEPKPLLKINEVTLLENCINLVQLLNVKGIKLYGGAHLIYEFFWESLAPISEGGGVEPSLDRDLGKAIKNSFGSFK